MECESTSARSGEYPAGRFINLMNMQKIVLNLL
jgi:hypothetical protein